DPDLDQVWSRSGRQSGNIQDFFMGAVLDLKRKTHCHELPGSLHYVMSDACLLKAKSGDWTFSEAPLLRSGGEVPRSDGGHGAARGGVRSVRRTTSHSYRY